MNPIPFKEQNSTYAKDQPEYMPLPCFKAKTPQGEVVSCWSMSWKERLTVLFTGRMWLSVWTFNKPLQPLRLTVCKGDLLEVKKPEKGEK